MSYVTGKVRQFNEFKKNDNYKGGEMMKLRYLFVVLLLVLVSFSFGKMIEIRVWDRVQEMGTIVDMFNEKMEEEGKDVRAVFELIPYEQQV